MTEKITCPYCERRIDLEGLEMADLFRERNDLAARLSSAWRVANEYLDAFRQTPGGRLSLKRRVRLLNELCRLWESGEFEYYGKRHRVEKSRIIEALTTVCNLEKRGFKDHAYLKKVLLSGSQRVSAEGLTAEDEAKRDARKLSEKEEQQRMEFDPAQGDTGEPEKMNYRQWVKRGQKNTR